MISVERFTGQISRMNARYVVLRGLDGTETLIPNETLVTSPVVNNSYSDPRVRATVTVQIDYRSVLLRDILRGYRANGIQIPQPRREARAPGEPRAP